MKIAKVGPYEVGGKNPIILLAGPCVIEGEERTMKIAEGIKEITDELGIPFVFKASYDKQIDLPLVLSAGLEKKRVWRFLKKSKKNSVYQWSVMFTQLKK